MWRDRLWCEALSSRGHNSEIRRSSSSRARDPFSPSLIWPSCIQMNNCRFWLRWFSTYILIVSTSGSESDHWCCPQLIFWSNSREYLGHRLLEIKFYEVSWCQMSSLVTLDTPGSLHTRPGSFSRSLISDDFWYICGVFMWCPTEESASHPLSSTRWVPQVSMIPNDKFVSNIVLLEFCLYVQRFKLFWVCH